MKTQKGFGIIEGFLILVIIGMISGVGYYVWSANKDSQKTLDNISQTEVTTSSKNPETEEDITKGWKAFSSIEGQFSIRTPGSWKISAGLPDCRSETIEIILIAASASGLGDACYGDQGQMSMISKKDNTYDNSLKPEYFDNYENKNITVEEISGTRTSGNFKKADDPYIPKGALLVTYSFKTNTRSYAFQYRQNPSYPDVLKDFDLMITKTLKFTP